MEKAGAVAKRRGRPKGAKSKPKKSPSPKKSAAMLPPVDVQDGTEKPQKSGGVLSEISSLFSANPNPPPQPETVSQSGSKTSSPSEPLPAEAEQLLRAIPGTIGDVGGALPGPVDASPAEDDPIAALMASVAFEPQDVQDVVEEFFEWCAERFKSDHWKLTERQSRMMGRPSALLLNSLWAKLQTILPDVLGRWCETTPGAMAFILACGIVVVPKVTTQIAVSRERAAAAKQRGLVKGTVTGSPVAQPKPPAPLADGLICQEGASVGKAA